MEDVSIPVPGGTINVWHRPATGASPTVVLIHGLSGNSRWWLRVIDHLPEETGVIGLDVRGRGGSAKSPPPYDLSTIADDVARSLDHFGVERAIVVGYSMGAWVAALFGTRYPQRVAHLVLVDGALPIPRLPDADAEETIDAVVGPSLHRLEIEFEDEESFYDYWKAHPALERHWDAGMSAALGHELESNGTGFRVRANREAIRETAREITIGETANQAFEDLNVPTKLIVVERGTADEPGGMIPLASAEQAVAANPRVRMEYLPDVNHYTLVLGEGAASVASAIMAG